MIRILRRGSKVQNTKPDLRKPRDNDHSNELEGEPQTFSSDSNGNYRDSNKINQIPSTSHVILMVNFEILTRVMFSQYIVKSFREILMVISEILMPRIVTQETAKSSREIQIVICEIKMFGFKSLPATS